MASGIIFGGFALLLFLNVPIAVAIGLALVAYIVVMGGVPLQFLAQTLFTSVDSFPLMAVPFFILAGAFMEGGGLSRRLVALANSLVGHITGGFAMVTVLTCMFFGAISGSGPATVAAVGVIMIPAMVKSGYPASFAAALTAAAGGLGVIIPPSIPMVIYSVATGASIGNLFMGGFLPGIICGLSLMSISYFVSKKRGYKGTEQKFSIKNVLKTAFEAKWALLVPVIILGGIYGGIFTPTEAAVVAVIYGFLVGKFVYKELKFDKIRECLVDSSLMVGAVLIIVGTGTALGRILTIEQIPTLIANSLKAISNNPIVILLLINILLLVVGCVMDTLAAILILAPILYPIVASLGVDITHFGLIMIANLAIGFITPPVGVNLFVASGVTGISFDLIAKAIWPFVVMLLIALAVITYIPDITLFLPRLFSH